MPKSTAERQAAYRKRQADDAHKLNVFIGGDAWLALGRLRAFHGLTQRALIETLLVQAEADLDRTLRNNATENQT